jgi:hypothetical protein
MDRNTIVGVFHNRDDAERAIDDLHRVGIHDDMIGFAWRGGDRLEGSTDITDHGTGAGAGAATGAVTGGVIGGLLGAAAALAVPGVGPVLAGGILASALGGAAIGAAAGGLLGALVGMGIPEEEARYYDTEFQSGRIILTVKADGRGHEIMDILRRHGAYDVNTRGSMGVGTTPSSTMGTTPTSMPVGTTSPSMGTGMHTTTTGMGMTHNWSDVSTTYRDRWHTRSGMRGGRWEDVEPGYRYGYEMATDPRFEGREWMDVEPELRSGYGTWSQRYGYHHDDSMWDRIRDEVRETWDEVRGRRRAA